MHGTMKSSVIDQYDRSILMFRETVGRFTADEWTKGDLDYLRPAGVAYHVIETIEFYTGDTPVNEFTWGVHFGCDWEDPDSTKLPSQQQILDYLDTVWVNAKAWIWAQDLDQPEPLFNWAGNTLHGRMLYLLRHIQHHTAEMSLELKRRGFQCPEWR